MNELPTDSSGTRATAVTHVAFTKAQPLSPVSVQKQLAQGLEYAYYEGFLLSTLIIDSVQPEARGAAKTLFDLSAKKTDGVYGFVYSGYLDVPRDGVYSFHAPKEILYPSIDAGYDLRVFPGKQEWYPATRWHNFGSWSVPLKRGLYPFQVVYVDQRGGGMALFGGGMNQ